jgi:glycopeptide antibiotics resistance protein
MNLFTYIPDLAVMAWIYIGFLRKRWIGNGLNAHFLFYLTVCFVFFVTLSPFIVNIPHLFGGIYSRYNFNPFVDLLNGYGSPLQECIENIVLFIPFAFAARLAYKASFWKTILWGVLFSLGIELIQPLISDIRVFDITDIITNTGGTFLGALLYQFVILIKHQ